MDLAAAISLMSAESPLPPIRHAHLSSVGRVRSGNEDFCLASVLHGTFIVCDGMGGAAAGEIASELAATTFLAHLGAAHAPETGRQPPRDLLLAAAAAANAAVLERARPSPALQGMGTTLVALHAEPASPVLWLVHIGDSRCYRLRAGQLQLMTEDHSLVQEQIRAGQITPQQAELSPLRNIITRAIGVAPEVEADVTPLRTEPGDLYLLATDGLTRELSDPRIADILMTRLASGPLLDPACAALVDAANAAGGHDNITVLLLAIGEPQIR